MAGNTPSRRMPGTIGEASTMGRMWARTGTRRPRSKSGSSVLHGRAREGRAGMGRALSVVVVIAGLWFGAAHAQTTLPFPVDPAMTKGRADAPVTIVEF